MIYSDPFSLTLSFVALLIPVYCALLFRRTAILSGPWRMPLFGAIIVNAICFTGIALFFFYTYGYITDDKGYYRNALKYTGSFSDISNGSQFMYYITRPLRKYLFLDLPSCHALFATAGVIGSLNHLYILAKRTDFTIKADRRLNALRLWALLCFPNFMAWGRFYGKDSTMFLLSSIYIYGCYKLFTNARSMWINAIIALLPLIFIFKLRAHIAGVFAIGFVVGLILTINEKTRSKDIAVRALLKVYLPVALIALLAGALLLVGQRMTRKQDLTTEAIQGTFVSSAKMGAYGGSSTDLSESLAADPQILFSPKQIFSNVLTLLFAPMPWQVRGGADIIAFASNIFLVILLIVFAKKVTLHDAFQKFLLTNTILLILLLSFMSGNVGLILRQKTIILPFLFLFLFSSSKPAIPTSKLPRRRTIFNGIQTQLPKQV